MKIIIIFRVLVTVFCACKFAHLSLMQGGESSAPATGLIFFGVAVVGLLAYRNSINRLPNNTPQPVIPYWQRPLPVAYVEPPAQSEPDRLPMKSDVQYSTGLHNDDLENCISFHPLSISPNELQMFIEILKYPLIIEKRYSLYEKVEVPVDDQSVVIIGCIFIVLILVLCATQQYNFQILNERNPVVEIARASSGDMPLEFVHAFLNLNTADLREVHLLLDDFSNWCHGRSR